MIDATLAFLILGARGRSHCRPHEITARAPVRYDTALELQSPRGLLAFKIAYMKLACLAVSLFIAGAGYAADRAISAKIEPAEISLIEAAASPSPPRVTIRRESPRRWFPDS